MVNSQSSINRCIHCIYCSMWDSTCTHPQLGFPTINYDHPACPHYEPETQSSIVNGQS